MTCTPIRMPGGGVAIVCDRRRRRRPPKCQIPGCERLGLLQCDFPLPNGKTCDRYLCADHAVPQGPNRDYCPHHPGQGDLFHRADAEREARGG